MAVLDLRFDPLLLSWVLGGLVQFAIAAWVYRIAPHDIRHRTFAFLLFVNGLWDVQIYGLVGKTTAASTHLSFRVSKSFNLWTALAFVAFYAHYPLG